MLRRLHGNIKKSGVGLSNAVVSWVGEGGGGGLSITCMKMCMLSARASSTEASRFSLHVLVGALRALLRFFLYIVHIEIVKFMKVEDRHGLQRCGVHERYNSNLVL